ncbi:MAG: glycosyltransferase family 4 protein [Lawsonibacter sp.]|nr:glycosyltransferase family 4 protein [Lawsonibacter sp.]
MIRVLNVISDTNIGGAGRVILNYLRYSDRDRFETWAALPRGSLLKPPLEEAGAQVIEVEGMADRSYHREDVKGLQALMGERRPDLVHTHGCLSGRIAAKRCGLPAVYSRHSAFPVPAKLKYPPGRWVNKFVNEHYADRIIAVSPATRDNLIEGGISPRKITVVMNGAAPVPRTGQEEQAALKRELSIPEGHTVFGILARLEDYKGHLDLLEAVRRLKERGREDFTVLAAGTGPFEGTLAQAVRQAGAEDRMKLLGFRSDVPALLNILDVQLNCSYGTEATSMALLEGMSLGLPTIASDYGGNPYVVEDGGTGLLFPSRNAAALAEAMERLMDRPEERKALGARARTVYEERFTGQVFARNTEKIYLDILKGAK